MLKIVQTGADITQPNIRSPEASGGTYIGNKQDSAKKAKHQPLHGDGYQRSGLSNPSDAFQNEVGKTSASPKRSSPRAKHVINSRDLNSKRGKLDQLPENSAGMPMMEDRKRSSGADTNMASAMTGSIIGSYNNNQRNKRGARLFMPDPSWNKSNY